jgi:maltooligosyltrehalose trehalohydrolase
MIDTDASETVSHGAREGECLAAPPGAIRNARGAVEWRLWAPKLDRVELLMRVDDVQRVEEMERVGEFYFLERDGIPDGTRYLFRFHGQELPDPASRWQPEGVHRASAVFSPELFAWTPTAWGGVAREDLVIYELHVGTFTPAGTFEAIIPRLSELKSLGVTAIEIMPVGEFPGTRNWGYDGVFPYAVQHSYGGPAGFLKFIDAAHQHGFAVILDVVYNHFGPEGNYLGQYGHYFTNAYRTPWGEAINFDGPDSDPVRQYVIENARMWIRDYRLDGLRLDAVHAIYDFGARHLLAEIQAAVQEIAQQQQRTVHVIAESDQNDPRLIDPPEQHGFGLSAVWADEFHHSLRSILAGDQQGYFEDFGEAEQLAKAYEQVFVYDGCYSSHRRRRHGAPVGNRDRTQFVHCIHNHDQIGNRALGDRSATVLSQNRQRLACGLLMLSPCVPLLFMGEEYAEEHPFPFFCSFGDEQLRDAVRRGRREEFAGLGFRWGDEIPDPNSEETFQSAILSWSWPEGSFHAQLRALYKELLAARRTWPALKDRQHTRTSVVDSPIINGHGGTLLIITRGESVPLTGIANLTEHPQALPDLPVGGRQFLLSTEEVRFGGERQRAVPDRQLLAFELMLFGPEEWNR